MKVILMLTDFSENADHAAKTVAKVAPQLNTIFCFTIPITTTAAALDLFRSLAK
ncbi:hypothetical protein IDJ75_03505 [Mucilaginibacter rigui]|uniref:UspA domain-containing protein n=1 Tax=Mucilaginibacter rigui TaxID=534635 RepID=A0ABR7X1E9_9SPHI|nr:hypothetical protein [Mucilaginibacter rigui]MBD1384331.1 hypothetical protein [Mucilaginibacter rigui]